MSRLVIKGKENRLLSKDLQVELDGKDITGNCRCVTLKAEVNKPVLAVMEMLVDEVDIEGDAEVIKESPAQVRRETEMEVI